MNVFFEESGSFKAGSVLSRQGDAFQVELPGGRRAKVRAKDVLIEFEKPTAGELMQQADAAAQDIEMGLDGGRDRRALPWRRRGAGPSRGGGG